MTALDQLRDEHMAAAAKRWQSACDAVAKRLTYDRSRDGMELTPAQTTEDALARRLTRRLLTARGRVLYAALGGHADFTNTIRGYPIPHGAIARLEFVDYFIGHEILDDGLPGIGHYRATMREPGHKGMFVTACHGDHPEARPYFHHSYDLLREKQPDAEMLCAGSAVAILDFHAKRGRQDLEPGERAQITLLTKLADELSGGA